MTAPQPIGIDPGTSHAAVAGFDHRGRVQLLRNAAGEPSTPSAVLFDDGEIVVGKPARQAAEDWPDRVALAGKRDAGQPRHARPIRGQWLPPQAILACLLRKMRIEVAEAHGQQLAAAVAVPACFDERSRRATLEAGQMAGWRVLDLVNEPTCAAWSYGEQIGLFADPSAPPQNILVYDLGGGKLDVALVEMSGRALRTRAADGDPHLGGIDWDERLAEQAAERFLQAHQVELRTDRSAWLRLLNQAEQTRQSLSQRTQATLQFEHAGLSLAMPVSRETFEQWTEDLLERSAFVTRQVLAAAGLNWGGVSRILLTGGAARMPMVGRMLRELSGQEPVLSATPEEDVARGAALFARQRLRSLGELPAASGRAVPAAAPRDVWTPPSLPGSRPDPHAETAEPTADLQIVEVNAHSLGVAAIDPQTMQRFNTILIPRGTPLPAAAGETQTTRTSDQRAIVVEVLEGETQAVELCRQVARAAVRDLPPGLPQGAPIEFQYEYSAGGLVSVRAALTEGTELPIELERPGGLSPEGAFHWRRLLAETASHGAWDHLLEQITLLPEMGAEPPDGGEGVAAVPAAEAEPERDFAAGAGLGEFPIGHGGGSVGEGYREKQEARRQEKRRRLAITLTGHVLASTLGLVLGYIILCWFRPQADFLGIFNH